MSLYWNNMIFFKGFFRSKNRGSTGIVNPKLKKKKIPDPALALILDPDPDPNLQGSTTLKRGEI
jgi:hypothetical protein